MEIGIGQRTEKFHENGNKIVFNANVRAQHHCRLLPVDLQMNKKKMARQCESRDGVAESHAHV